MACSESGKHWGLPRAIGLSTSQGTACASPLEPLLSLVRDCCLPRSEGSTTAPLEPSLTLVSSPTFRSAVSLKIPRFHRRTCRGALLCLGVFLLMSNFVNYGYCIQRGNFASSALQDRSASLSPPSDENLSNLQTETKATPSLNLEEDQNCLFSDTVPENVKNPRNKTELKVTQWAEHADDKVTIQDTLKAYQTTNIPGRERQFMISFKLPDDLADSGEATLTMTKDWDGASHGWSCISHTLKIIRLSSDNYLSGRNAASETGDTFMWDIGNSLTSYSANIANLVYGKKLKGERLHLLFREAGQNCLSSFKAPNNSPPPKLVVETEMTESKDAVYDNWGAYTKCRVSCITLVNYQCRKRKCTPGANNGAPCKDTLMVDKQPCTDPSVTQPCTCAKLAEEKACPLNSICNDSVPNSVNCRCTGAFSRESVAEKTVCEPAINTGVNTLPDVEESGNSLLLLWVIFGVFGSLVLVGCLMLLCVKKKKMKEEDLLMNANVSLSPGSFAAPQSGAGLPGAFPPSFASSRHI